MLVTVKQNTQITLNTLKRAAFDFVRRVVLEEEVMISHPHTLEPYFVSRLLSSWCAARWASRCSGSPSWTSACQRLLARTSRRIYRVQCSCQFLGCPLPSTCPVSHESNLHARPSGLRAAGQALRHLDVLVGGGNRLPQ